MKRKSLIKIAIATSTVACAALLSFDWSAQRGISLSVESAEARVGRPLTPVSVAGVARRQYRRGAIAVGAGVAAVGTAAAVAASGPYATGPFYTGDRYYGQRAWGANAYYPAPATTTSSAPYDAVRAYYARGPWYGYNGWDDYQARNGIRCTPGSSIKLDDGLMYACQ
jgi:hypothetical protein